MERETPGEKWDRLKDQIQEGILNGYLNPGREGCPGDATINELATRSANIDDDSIEDDPQWQHVTHCSPCYSQYLEQFARLRARSHAAAVK